MKLRWMCGVAVAAAMGSCASTLWIKAHENLNPDQATSKPSPVTIWICQLRGDATFRKANVAMIGGARAALAADLLSEQEIVISPGQSFEQKLNGVALHAEARYIGVVANFIAPVGNKWKEIVSVDEASKWVFCMYEYEIKLVAR